MNTLKKTKMTKTGLWKEKGRTTNEPWKRYPQKGIASDEWDIIEGKKASVVFFC